jgi:hypothetical protein
MESHVFPDKSSLLLHVLHVLLEPADVALQLLGGVGELLAGLLLVVELVGHVIHLWTRETRADYN